MEADRKIIFALIAGAVIGGSIVQALHAVAKPPAYVVGEVDVTNHDALIPGPDQLSSAGNSAPASAISCSATFASTTLLFSHLCAASRCSSGK